MRLYTQNHDPSWDRTVYICVEQCEGLSESINDSEMYKLMLVDSGTLIINVNGLKRVVAAPALVLLTEEKVSLSLGENLSTTTVFLKPTEIREEFTIDRIKSGEFENSGGRTIYHDYLLVKTFDKNDKDVNHIYNLGPSSYSKISKIIQLMDKELTIQSDGYWPCRSRSYMMELLYYISYVCEEKDDSIDTVSDGTVSEIMQYLSEHIGDKITLEDIMKEFSINRNRLNELFVKETSMTCLNYLVKMRINLAQIMLAETELQIAEISDRVGYEDPNYFIKVFKKNTGVTPSKYRDSFLK